MHLALRGVSIGRRKSVCRYSNVVRSRHSGVPGDEITTIRAANSKLTIFGGGGVNNKDAAQELDLQSWALARAFLGTNAG